MRGHRATTLLHRSATTGTQSRAVPPQRGYQHSFVGRTIEQPDTSPRRTIQYRSEEEANIQHTLALNLSLQNIVGGNQGFELEYFVMVCIGLVMVGGR